MSSPINSVGRLQSAPQNNCDTNLNSTANTNAGHNDNDVSSEVAENEIKGGTIPKRKPHATCDIWVQ